MDGWRKKKRMLMAAQQPPPAPKRKSSMTHRMAHRKRALELEDAEWLLGGGPAPVEGPPSKLTCTPPSSEDESVLHATPVTKPVPIDKDATPMDATPIDTAPIDEIESKPPVVAKPADMEPRNDILSAHVNAVARCAVE